VPTRGRFGTASRARVSHRSNPREERFRARLRLATDDSGDDGPSSLRDQQVERGAARERVRGVASFGDVAAVEMIITRLGARSDESPTHFESYAHAYQ
jgi:hypothetical protein